MQSRSVALVESSRRPPRSLGVRPELLKPRAIIELSETTLSVTSWKPRGAPATLSHTFAPLDLAEAWPESLRELTDHFHAMVAKAGLKGAPATVLYKSATSACGVYPCPVAAGSKGCEQAVQLAFADACEMDLSVHPFGLARIAGDRPEPEAGGLPQQAHYVAGADEDASLQALSTWVASAGLRPDQFVPLESLALVGAAREALRLADKHGPVAVLNATEGASALAVASAGKLWFVRQLAVGKAALVQTLTRGVRRSASDASPIALTFQEAREAIGRFGIPGPQDSLGAFEKLGGLTGAQVLPLLQPVLQRWTVELKQSLRYGLPKDVRERARLVMIGAGRRVAHLEAIFAAEAGLEILACAGDDLGEAKPAWAVWQALRRSSVGLVPRTMQTTLRAREFRRMLAAGCVAAAAVVGANGWLTQRDVREAHARIAQLRQETEALRPATLAFERVTRARAGLDQAAAQAESILGDRVAWADWLAALNAAVPEGVRVASIRLGTENRQPVCVLSGRTDPGTADQTSGRIKAYLDELALVPLTQACRIGRTERIGTQGRAFQTFEISVQLVSLPATLPDALASVEEAP